MSIEEKRKQARKQHEAIAYIAQAIAKISHEYNAYVIDNIKNEDVLDVIGKASHGCMQDLADILNEMDAVEKKDEDALNPIFEAARKMFPIAETEEQPS